MREAPSIFQALKKLVYIPGDETEKMMLDVAVECNKSLKLIWVVKAWPFVGYFFYVNIENGPRTFNLRSGPIPNA